MDAFTYVQKCIRHLLSITKADQKHCLPGQNFANTRRIFLYLSLCLHRAFIKNQVLMLFKFLSPEDGYNEKSINVFINNECKRGYLTTVDSANGIMGRYVYYTMTKPGLEYLISTLQDGPDVLPEVPSRYLDSISEKYSLLQASYANNRRNPISKHYTATTTAMIQLLYSSHCSPMDYSLPLKLEISPSKIYAEKQSMKTKFEVVADILMKPMGGYQNIFFEIDMNTERPSGPSGLLNKLSGYCSVAKNIAESSPLYPFNLVFVHTGVSAPSKKDARNCAIPQDVLSLLKSDSLPLYITLCITLSIIRRNSTLSASELSSGGTVADILNWLPSYRDVYLSQKRGRQFDMLIKLLSCMANLLNPDATVIPDGLIESGHSELWGQLPVQSIAAGIESLASYHWLPAAEMTEHERANLFSIRKRNSMYRMAAEDGYHTGLLSYPDEQLGALLRGMTLSCCHNYYLDATLPYIFPEYYFPASFEDILCHLHLTAPVPQKISASRPQMPNCRPLQNFTVPDENGQMTYRYGVYMRNLFSYNGIDICIENISHDIGGFFRAQEYLRLPPSFRPRTLLLLLLSDDLIMANGEDVRSGTLFSDVVYDENRKKQYQYFHYGYTDINSLYQSYINDFGKQNISPKEECILLPFLYAFTQDVCMLTYSEFKRSEKENVRSWLALPDGNIIHRMYLPDDSRLTPSVPLLK